MEESRGCRLHAPLALFQEPPWETRRVNLMAFFCSVLARLFLNPCMLLDIDIQDTTLVNGSGAHLSSPTSFGIIQIASQIHTLQVHGKHRPTTSGNPYLPCTLAHISRAPTCSPAAHELHPCSVVLPAVPHTSPHSCVPLTYLLDHTCNGGPRSILAVSWPLGVDPTCSRTKQGHARSTPVHGKTAEGTLVSLHKQPFLSFSHCPNDMAKTRMPLPAYMPMLVPTYHLLGPHAPHSISWWFPQLSPASSMEPLLLAAPCGMLRAYVQNRWQPSTKLPSEAARGRDLGKPERGAQKGLGLKKGG